MSAMTQNEPTPELHFPAGIPGFPGARRFALLPAVDDPETPLFQLRSLDDGGPEFAVVAPAPFFPDYAPEIGDADAEAIGLEAADDALLLLILTVGEDLTSTTANLFAPVIVNQRTREAAQVVLVGSGYELRVPLLAA